MTTSMMNPDGDLEQKYPSVELAYPIAVNSYEVATKRLDVMDGRLQTIVAFSVTVAAAFTSLAGARGVSFSSAWFWLSLALLVLCVVLGTAGRLVGRIRLLDPMSLYSGWLHESPWEFKKNLVFFAGESFAQNMRLVFLRWRYSVVVTCLFVLQVGCLVVWVVTVRNP